MSDPFVEAAVEALDEIVTRAAFCASAHTREALGAELLTFVAAAWAEGFEAGADWSPSYPSGVSCDPPRNPYDRED